jgi:hypothetical protein
MTTIIPVKSMMTKNYAEGSHISFQIAMHPNITFSEIQTDMVLSIMAQLISNYMCRYS